MSESIFGNLKIFISYQKYYVGKFFNDVGYNLETYLALPRLKYFIVMDHFNDVQIPQNCCKISWDVQIYQLNHEKT
ncbi:CLUMA_CG014862, isoform A [Clunio marinus]|uniref:CLUMA_CG014862, isoform A n=1 Tax=Clunio marinus TaxID=568069 RepID=A0A1J1IN31_9DIPT|nr:CLUMA_CG014862, isoform A [Clunio marinus]